MQRKMLPKKLGPVQGNSSGQQSCHNARAGWMAGGFNRFLMHGDFLLLGKEV